jgi:hypothetical protein
MKELSTARLILGITCGTYLLSAALLGWAKYRGQPVTAFGVTGWAVTGAVGLALLPWLTPKGWGVIIAIAAVLGPWMVYALVSDLRLGHWIIAVMDFAGLVAIAFSLWLVV